MTFWPTRCPAPWRRDEGSASQLRAASSASPFTGRAKRNPLRRQQRRYFARALDAFGRADHPRVFHHRHRGRAQGHCVSPHRAAARHFVSPSRSLGAASVDDEVASPEGLEPPTSDLEGRCSIQLSYGLVEGREAEKDGRGGGIRTHDHLVPNQVRYQAALRPERRIVLSARAPSSAPAASVARRPQRTAGCAARKRTSAMKKSAPPTPPGRRSARIWRPAASSSARRRASAA